MQAPSRQVTGPALRALLEDGTLAGEWVPLRSAEIFDSGNYPHITFTADGIRLTGQDLAVAGALTVRDRTGRCPSMRRRRSRRRGSLARRRRPHQPVRLRPQLAL